MKLDQLNEELKRARASTINRGHKLQAAYIAIGRFVRRQKPVRNAKGDRMRY